MPATLLSATPCCLKYALTSAAGGAINIDALGAGTPDLITDSPVGSPIRQLVSQAYGSQAAARTATIFSTQFHAKLTKRDVDALWIVDANVNGTALRLTATAAAQDVPGTILTLRYEHSATR
jgi:hypothetical protein